MELKPTRDTVALLRMAMAYADAYPQEVQDGAALAARRDYDGMKEEIAELELL